MLATKPVKSEDLAIGWIEYLAEFKNLSSQLDIAVNDLNLVQYFAIDIVSCLVIIVAIIIYSIYSFIRCNLRKFCFF